MKSREISEQRDPSMGHPKERDREAEKKAMLNRMARAIGHMEAVKRMKWTLMRKLNPIMK